MTPDLHRRTPALAVSDARGLPVRQVAYWRAVAEDTPAALITRQRHDSAGRLIEQWDPRLKVPALTSVHHLNGTVLRSASVDSGWRLHLPGLAGEPLQRWDERNTHWRSTFDAQLRVLTLAENDEVVDTFTYADALADAGRNQRGQLLEQKDRSGTLTVDSFSLASQALNETRTFQDGAALGSQYVFSPLGAVLEQTDAGGHRQRSRYGLAGRPRQLHLLVNGHSDWQAVLQDAQYNAANQIIEQLAGNQVRSHWTYDPADGRLHTRSSRKSNGDTLQDFEYVYDRVGNIMRIEDHAFQTRYFANQIVEGHRDFSYDSLYRLISATGYDDAPPSDIPGLPQPGDPNNRLNYTQTYQYDHGGNLTELRHVRAGNSYTRQMRIDPQSNRGVRWQPGDGEPDFGTLFDRHGNQQAVHPGKPLSWNARDEVQQVILVAREDQHNDVEHYGYSQGARVFKRHEYLAANAEHFHQVRYLPGLEIRTKDNGEELHVISVGSARCLHWAQSSAPRNDQMRYTLEDHLGSCVMELNEYAVVTSAEGYYPFGETAWMAPESEIEYRFIRYSGKEMDVSGLYYYGARYYAPWLQRWVSADPAGDVDGLNLYGFVENNPLTYIDMHGEQKTPAELKADIIHSINFLSVANAKMDILESQIKNLSSPWRFRSMIGMKLLIVSAKAVFNFIGTTSGFDKLEKLAGGDPFNPGELKGLTIGNMVGDAIGNNVDKLASGISALNAPIIPRKSDIAPRSVQNEASGLDSSPLDLFVDVEGFGPPQFTEAAMQLTSSILGSQLYGVGELMELAKVSEDGSRAEEGMFTQEINAHIEALQELYDITEKVANNGQAAFNQLGLKEFYSSDLHYLYDLFRGTVGTQQSGTVKHGNLSRLTERALYTIRDRQEMFKKYGRQAARN